MAADDLSQAWTVTQSQLPAGWTLDGLRCASRSLHLEDRSDDWIAVAVGPDGAERTWRAAGPKAALDGLVDSLASS